MAFMLVLAMMPLTVQYAFAESEADVTVDGCGFHLWYSDAGASVAVRSYSGSATEVKLPASVYHFAKTSFNVLPFEQATAFPFTVTDQLPSPLFTISTGNHVFLTSI